MTRTPFSPARSTLSIATHSTAQTRMVGQVLGASLRHSQVIALQGDLGSGKTTLTQGIAAGLGIGGRVTSPTFTLVNEYVNDGTVGEDGRVRTVRLVHVDSYRLGDSADEAVAEAATFGMEELLAEVSPDALDGQGETPPGTVAAPITVMVIEWAERLTDLLPADRLDVHLCHVADRPEVRRIRLVAGGVRSVWVVQAVGSRVQIQPLLATDEVAA